VAILNGTENLARGGKLIYFLLEYVIIFGAGVCEDF